MASYATPLRQRASVLLPRLVLFSIILTAILIPSVYQPLLGRIWSFLSHSSFYSFSGFETIETILCYGVVEFYYNYRFIYGDPSLHIDIRGPKQATPDSKYKLPRMRLPDKRMGELAIYIAPLFALDFTLIKKYADVPANEIRQSGGYPAITSSISPSFLLPTFHNFSISSPLQLHRALPTNPPSSRRLVLELIIAFFIYDTLFFLAHLALHRISSLAAIHKPHHRHGEMNPQVTNQLSIPERLSLVLLANFSLNIIKSHVLTRTAFVPFFVYLLIDIHSGLDLDWSYDKLLPTGWGAGATKHARHHKDGEGRYESFFCWWDNGLELLDRWRLGRV